MNSTQRPTMIQSPVVMSDVESSSGASMINPRQLMAAGAGFLVAVGIVMLYDRLRKAKT